MIFSIVLFSNFPLKDDHWFKTNISFEKLLCVLQVGCNAGWSLPEYHPLNDAQLCT